MAGTGVVVGRYGLKENYGIDSFEKAQKFLTNIEKMQIGSVSLTKEQALKWFEILFKNPGKYMAKRVAMYGVIGLAIGGLVALCKSNKN